MRWNWEKPDWPDFSYNPEQFSHYEDEFLVHVGRMVGLFEYISDEKQEELRVELL